jgi:hypothetical protein
MNNNLYFKYYLLLLLTLNTINVYSFNPRSNRIINFPVRNVRNVRNVKMCSVGLSKEQSNSSYNRYRLNKIIIKNNKIDDKLINLQNMTLSNNTVDIKLNTLFFNKLLFYYNNYTYYCLIIK